MPKTKPTSENRAAALAVCDLCGLVLRSERIEAEFAGRTYRFCCAGCRQVFNILLQASGSADPDAFRRSELYRQCQKSGIIPSPAGASPLTSPASAAAVEPSAPEAEGLSLTLRVENMWCPACAWLIETALSRTPGILSATCGFVTDQLRVKYDPVATDPGRIRSVVENFGYTVTPSGDRRDQGLRRREWARFGIATFLTMNVMMLSSALYFGFFTDLPAESVASISWPMAVMAAAVMGYGGIPFFRRAWQGLRQTAFSMDALITVGALSAFGFSTFNLLTGSIHLYYDTACMLVTLVLLGKILERRAKDEVLEGLQGLLSLMPTKVRIVEEAFPEGRFVAAERLAAGDLFRVAENEVVAADGIVVSGGGTSDESSITGEPRPVLKKPGDPIRSGSRMHHGSVTICANRVGAESTLGQMIAVVQNTLALKTPGGDRTGKILQGFVPVILVLAVATGIFIWLQGQAAGAAMLRAVTVTVIACPCALGIAIPLARVAGVALAARQGILIRSFSAFERAETIDTLVLDKTGTVTRGEWHLTHIVPFGNFTRDKILALAAGLEQGASHPIALELLRETRERHIRPERVAVVQDEGHGISGLWEGLEVKIGAAEFLAEELAGQEMRLDPLRRHATGSSFVYLSVGGRPAAVLVFGDELREGIEPAVTKLQRRGLRLILVSGDGVETTRAIGRQLGITEALGSQLPAEKAAFVSHLQNQRKKVLMVGDGINDAPALAQADLSLAVFAGGNLGKEVADATLMRAEPSQITEFLDFTCAVNRKIRQNLLLTFLYNAVSIPVAMSGLLSPLVAVCAMLLSSLSVIGNTYLLVRKHSTGGAVSVSDIR
ncbi:MAG: heavy metal translocating P-type ATPase [Desulfobacterales bacterium]|jgi:heavy metal translocating P-type ATPase|nr:heavy metal translocating P-type ATPase [Desulfobacterales bacterium]